MENLQKLLDIARKNGQQNPALKDAKKALEYYLQGVKDEIKEVEEEIKPSNSVYLTDELSDVLWDFFNLLVSLERLGYIDSAEEVFFHAAEKYNQRSKAMWNADFELWEEIKQNQKQTLKQKHSKKHGN